MCHVPLDLRWCSVGWWCLFYLFIIIIFFTWWDWFEGSWLWNCLLLEYFGWIVEVGEGGLGRWSLRLLNEGLEAQGGSGIEWHNWQLCLLGVNLDDLGCWLAWGVVGAWCWLDCGSLFLCRHRLVAEISYGWLIWWNSMVVVLWWMSLGHDGFGHGVCGFDWWDNRVWLKLVWWWCCCCGCDYSVMSCCEGVVWLVLCGVRCGRIWPREKVLKWMEEAGCVVVNGDELNGLSVGLEKGGCLATSWP